MDAKRFEEILRKYNNPSYRIAVPGHVRKDIQLMIDHLNTMHRTVSRLQGELLGATQTMIAITKSMGQIELPFALIDSLTDSDRLGVIDVKTPDGQMFKRFEYRTAAETPPDAPLAYILPGARTVQ